MKTNNMMLAANEQGSILLDIALFFGLLAVLAIVGLKVITPLLGKVDSASCGIMENCG